MKMYLPEVAEKLIYVYSKAEIHGRSLSLSRKLTFDSIRLPVDYQLRVQRSFLQALPDPYMPVCTWQDSVLGVTMDVCG